MIVELGVTILLAIAVPAGWPALLAPAAFQERQDTPRWGPAAEVAGRDAGVPMPLVLHVEKNRMVLATLWTGERSELALYESRDGGVFWSALGGDVLGGVKGPPCAVVFRDQLHVLWVDRPRRLMHQAFLLQNGKAGRAERVEVAGVERFDNDFIPTALVHKGTLYYLGAPSGKTVAPFLLQTKDGRAWERIETPAWNAYTHGWTRTLFFVLNDSLHVVPYDVRGGESGVFPHYERPVAGHVWSKGKFELPGIEGNHTFLIDVASTETGVISLYWVAGAVRTAHSPDGRRWKAGPILTDLGDPHPASLGSLDSDGKTLLWETTLRKEEKLISKIFCSPDGGRTWTALVPGKGLARESAFPLARPLPDGAIGVAMANLNSGKEEPRFVLFRRWGFPNQLPEVPRGPLTAEECSKVEEYLRGLRDADPARRQAATEALSRFGPRASPLLEEALRSEPSEEAKERIRRLLKLFRRSALWRGGE